MPLSDRFININIFGVCSNSRLALSVTIPEVRINELELGAKGVCLLLMDTPPPLKTSYTFDPKETEKKARIRMLGIRFIAPAD